MRAIVLLLAGFLAGCHTSRPQGDEAVGASAGSLGTLRTPSPPTQPILESSQVMQLALDYARQQQWEVKSVWSGMPMFDGAKREWRIFIDTRQNGGPMIVSIKDTTRRISFVRGE
jgi:hypothetical protein